MNRKIQFNVLVMILALTVLSLIFACYVLIRNWKWNPFYKLRATSEIVREIEMSAFGEQFPCLEYVEGLICHGKDTFEVAKFRINKEEVSWASLSNIIYVSKVFQRIDKRILPDEDFTVSPAIKRVQEKTEVICEEFDRELMSLYLSYNIDGNGYLYVEGRLVKDNLLCENPESFDAN